MNSSDLYREKELLTQIAQGDKAAFKVLHDHYWNDLYHISLSFLKSSEWAQDIVQDVFLKIWNRRESLGHVESFKAYLFTIVRNQLITAINKNLRDERGKERYRQSLPDSFLVPDSPLAVKELQGHINDAIATLPEQQRVMLELSRKEGLSHEEIATRLGVARKTVANTITKALNNIRQYLMSHGDELTVLLVSILIIH